MKLIDILNESYKDKGLGEALTKKGSTVDDQDKQSRIRYDLLVNMDDFVYPDSYTLTQLLGSIFI